MSEKQQMHAAASALDGSFEIAPELVAEFQRDGQVVLRGVASPDEVTAYRSLIDEAVQDVAPHVPSEAEGDVYAKAFSQYMNLWQQSPTVAPFTLSTRFARIAARLLGVSSVRVYHDQALFKPGGGGRTPWHQDMHYWPLSSDRAITMWMPLVDVTPEMGELQFAAESHRDGPLTEVPISGLSDTLLAEELDRRGYARKSTGVMAAGDASFHASWMLHAASPNRTERTREVMTVIWFEDGAVVTEPTNDGQRADLQTWLQGLKPGDVAAGPLNPNPTIDA